MADSNMAGFPPATLPVSGTNTAVIDQGDGVAKKVALNNLPIGSLQQQAVDAAVQASKKPAVKQGTDEFTDIASWSAHTLLFTQPQVAAVAPTATSLYWPWVIETSRIASPLGKYYMYYSTDHDAGQGGIFMSWANNLTGPWTHVGLVYADPSGSLQTETPSVIWDRKNARFVMYYQQTAARYGGSNSLNANGVQSTLMAYSTDGINWTKDPNFVVDLPFTSTQIGDGHTGYFLPFETRQGLFAYSLYGGTDSFGNLLWQCKGELGGINSLSNIRNEWLSDRKLLGYGSDVLYNWEPATFGATTVQRYLQFNHSFVVESQGTEYWVGIVSNLTSGGNAKTARIAVAPVSSNYKAVIGTPVCIWNPVESWENSDMRTVTPFVENGILYIFYSINKTSIGVFSHAL